MVATNYSATGIPGLNGGYAYAPGTSMAQFMDGVNATTSMATQMPGGQSIIGWATGLAQQQQARNAAQAYQASQQAAQAQMAMANAFGGGTPNANSEVLSQIFSTLTFIISNLMNAKA